MVAPDRVSRLFRGHGAAVEVAMNVTACCTVGNGDRVRSRSLQVAQHDVPDGEPFFRSTDNLDKLREEAVEAIVQKMVEKAKEGDATAARTILDRVWPARKGARLVFELPQVTTADDLPGAVSAVTQQVADGEILPDEGAAVVALLKARRKAIEASDLATRIAALEERMTGK